MEFLTAGQLAQSLNVKRGTVYRWANEGTMPAVRLGNVWRFPKSEIEAWIESNRVKKSTTNNVEDLHVIGMKP
jgi:excisionase family DNA binding protein